MTGVAKSFNAYIDHTGRYYSRLFAPKSVRLFMVLMTATLLILAIATSVVVTHAGLANWVMSDVFNTDALNSSYYNYVASGDAPALSNNTYHLQMPMTIEGYLGSDLYVSGGTASPDAPKIDDSLKNSLNESYFADFELAPPEEFEDSAADGGTEFVVNRPPQSGLG